MLLQINSVADGLNSSEWLFPIAECFHITAFAWSIGMIAVVDHKLLGFGIQRSKPSAILRDTAPWTLLGLVVVLLSGSILFLTDVGADSPRIDHSFSFETDHHSPLGDRRGRSEATLAF